MKVTGIIKRLDEVGRIAIPKEIRRKLGLSVGDPIEIYIDTTNNGIVLVPYNYPPQTD